MNLKEKQIVRIKATEELPTRWDGELGTFWRNKIYHGEEFALILVHSLGETVWFHESQIGEV